MDKRLGLLIVMIVVLAGCQSTGGTPDLFEEDNSSLPASWTIEVSKTTSHTETPGLDADEIPSSTPDFLPPSLSPSPETYLPQLALTYQALPDLISGRDVSIQKINMATAEKGWAIGSQNDEFHYILFSHDGGHSWQDRTPPILIPSEFQRNIDNIIAHFYDENTAWALIENTKDNLNDSNYLVWRTEDSGLTWIPSDPLPFPLGQFYANPGGFSFITPEIGWLWIQTELSHIHDLSYLFSTRDGGATWNLINRPGNGMIEVYLNTGMAFANENDGWVTKDGLGSELGPFIEQTRDGGKTWEEIYLPHPDGNSGEENPQSCQTIKPTFTSSQTGLLLAQCFLYDTDNLSFNMDNPYTYIFATSDWGESWQAAVLPSPVDELVFIDFLTGFALGKDHYQSTNGGADWARIKTVTWQGEFSFINAQEGWAVARRDSDIAFVHTTNGGLTYQEITPIVIP
jgi:photosystem II stability/assembly factor-like uncharacterized protein